MVLRRGAWRIALWIVGAAIVAVAGSRLARNWEELRHQPLQWEVRPGYLIAAVLLTWAVYGLLIHAWRMLLGSWGAQLDGYTAARIWTISSLGKYLPGKVWAIAGMALLAQRAGIAPWIATGSAVLQQALAVAGGGAIVGVTGMAPLESTYPWLRPALLIIAALSAIGMGLLLWRPFVERLFRLAGLAPEQATTPSPTTLLAVLSANVLAWVGYGSAFVLLAHGLLPDVQLDLPLAISAFTASYLAGFLAVIAPGGLLVREGTLFLMLQSVVGPAAAGALVIASRIMLTITEFGAALPFVVHPRSSGEPTSVVNSRSGNSNSTS